MRKILILFFILIHFYSEAQTQEASASGTSETPVVQPAMSVTPPTRSRIDDLQKESSSFVADPDPLDPLPLKKESLKEDEEPVLEDIRQVLNSPKKKTSSPLNKNKPVVKITTENKPFAKKVRSKKIAIKKIIIKKTKTTAKKMQMLQIKPVAKKIKKLNLNPDEPDLALEQRLNQNYNKFDVTPTSQDTWNKVTSDRKVDVFVIQKGNTLESISRMLFGDSYFWPKIWALNHSDIMNPHFIYPGRKIYFYPATESEQPSLSFDYFEADPKVATSGKSLDERDYSQQNTLFNQYNVKYGYVHKKMLNVPTLIPQSIPIVRSKDYFIKPIPQETVLDIIPVTQVPLSLPKNIFTLSSAQLNSDYSVPLKEIDSLICNSNTLVKNMTRLNPQATAGDYLIVELQNTQNTRLKKTYIYKTIGEVEISENLKMRIKNCEQIMTSDTLIVSKEKLETLPAPTEVFLPEAHIIESLEAQDQDYFNYGQSVIINSDPMIGNVGDVLNVYSDQQGKDIAHLQILKKTGTLAIGFLTQIIHVVNIGDQIVPFGPLVDGLEKFKTSSPSPVEKIDGASDPIDELKLD